jgi:hypothetical protein
MGMPTSAQSEAFGVFRPTRPVNRAEPILPPQAMKTYGIACPIPTHFREATCEEVLCPQHVSGWRTVCSTKTELGVQQIKYIREQSGRHFTITGPDQAGDVAFIFRPDRSVSASMPSPWNGRQFTTWSKATIAVILAMSRYRNVPLTTGWMISQHIKASLPTN